MLSISLPPSPPQRIVTATEPPHVCPHRLPSLWLGLPQFSSTSVQPLILGVPLEPFSQLALQYSVDNLFFYFFISKIFHPLSLSKCPSLFYLPVQGAHPTLINFPSHYFSKQNHMHSKDILATPTLGNVFLHQNHVSPVYISVGFTSVLQLSKNNICLTLIYSQETSYAAVHSSEDLPSYFFMG